MSKIRFQPAVLALVLLVHGAGAWIVVSRLTMPSPPLPVWFIAAGYTLGATGLISFLASAQRLIRLPLPALLIAGYFVGVITAWLFRLRTGRFPGVLDLELLVYLVHPFTTLVVEPGVWLLIALVGVVATVATGIIIRGAPEIRGPLSWWMPAGVVAVSCLYPLSLPVPGSLQATLPEAALAAAVSQLWQDSSSAGAEQFEPRPQRASGELTGASVLILVVEALRRDMVTARQPDGTPIMPFLGGLARQGNAYAEAYAQASDSEMSSLAILTGRYPLQNRLRPTLDPEVTLLNHLRRHDYATAHLSSFEGAWGALGEKHVDFHSDPAFDGGAADLEREQIRGKGHPPHPQEIVYQLDVVNERRFGEWLTEQADSRRVGVYMVLYGSHFPYSAELALEHPTYYFPRRAAARVFEEYQRALTRADAMVERVVARMREYDPASIIVITGDHGEEFYEHGGYLHAGQLSPEVMNVPLLVSGLPDHCQKPTAVHAPVAHIDIVPTVLDALGDPGGMAVQGVSICGRFDPTRPIFSSSRALRLEDAAIVEGMKYVVPIDGYDPRVFDLRKDPGEQRNLIGVAPEKLERGKMILAHFRARQRYFYELGKARDFIPPHYDGRWLAGLSAVSSRPDPRSIGSESGGRSTG